MSITDSATGGVEEPDSVISSDSQETSQGVVAEQAEAVHASEDAPAAEADKAAEQDTRDADTSEATDPIEGFENLGLPSEVLKAITKVGFETPSPIQAHTIPVLMDGHDVVGLAQTGTGKTAAFALPILSRMTQNDALMEYLQTQGSGMYVVPAGVGKADSMIGQRLFE